MTTLRQEVLKLKVQQNVQYLTQIREIFEDTRENVHKIMEKKSDLGLTTLKEQQEIKQINENIALIIESIDAINSIKNA